MRMSAYILPSVIIFLLLYSIYKKKNAYQGFVHGSKSSFKLIFTIFPYLVAILVLLELYTTSGLSTHVSKLLAPAFSFVGIPTELIELVVIKNFSGSGGIAVLENILTTYGADSYIGRCASVIASTSEAVFFVTAIYFAGTKIEKYSKVIAIALIANFCAVVLACFVCKYI